MSLSNLSVDRIYLAACARDARLTRICLASIRYFYPDAPIQILAGDVLQPGLAEELKKHWNVEVADLPPGDYGWGLVKLEPLFGPPGQRFLVMDVDTAFTGKVLDERAKSDAPFFVDDEVLSDADFKRLYYDWDKLCVDRPRGSVRPQVVQRRPVVRHRGNREARGVRPLGRVDPAAHAALPGPLHGRRPGDHELRRPQEGGVRGPQDRPPDHHALAGRPAWRGSTPPTSRPARRRRW